jgi:hypothetical protein
MGRGSSYRRPPVQPVRGITMRRTALRCTSVHRFQAAAVFYPDFYPNGQCSGIETPYLLVTAANWDGRPERVTSLPSWSCGFDSRRPLQFAGFFRFRVPVGNGSGFPPGRKLAYYDISPAQ